MSEDLFPVAALVAAFVAAEPLAHSASRRGNRRDRKVLVAAIATSVLAYFFLGMISAWPAALLAGLTSLAGLTFDQRARSAGGWLWIRLGVLAALTATGAWLVPLLFSGSAVGQGIAEALLWPREAYVIMITIAGAYVTVEWGCPWVERAIQPFAAAVSAFHAATQGLPNGGRMIGRLERLLIYLFVLIGAPTAIGFLVTAKSILRFGEIKDKESHRMAEYIIIGTLMSFGFAIVSAYLVRLMLGYEFAGGI